MLDEVHIQGYKSLADVTFEPGRFNVFVGSNGSGKTNLLEAIGLLGCAARGRVDDAAFKERGVRPGLPALYKTAFRGRRVRPAISLAARAGVAEYRVSLNNPIKDPAQSWGISHEAVIERTPAGPEQLASRGPGAARIQVDDGASVRLDKHSSIAALARGVFPDTHAARLLDALDDYGIYTPFTPMLRGTTADDTQRQPRPTGLMGGRLAEAVREARSTPRGRAHLQAAHHLIDWMGDFQIGSASEANLSPSVASTRAVLGFRDRHMTERRNTLSAFDASEGALYVMFLLTLVAHPTTPPIAAVDNVDQALNPRLARELVRTVQRIVLEDDAAPQLLLTAHNAQVLDGLALDDDRVRLFVVDRDSRGATTVRRISVDGATRAKMETAGKPLSQLWTEGWLGGMPNI